MKCECKDYEKLACIFYFASLFNFERAVQWMATAHEMFGGISANEFIESDNSPDAVEKVLAEIGRIKFGVY